MARGIQVSYTQDKSKAIRQMLSDLQNSVITGVLLVAIIILFALGFRASLFIGIAIPASFLTGMLGLQLAGLTVNIVVLFSLILAVGMLVDDAIIVSEFAERRMAEGMPPREAYSMAAKRMAGPVTAATSDACRGVLAAAVLAGRGRRVHEIHADHADRHAVGFARVALFFTPTLGALLGRAAPVPHDERAKDRGLYMRTVRLALRHPGTTLLLALALLVGVQMAYGKLGTRRRVLSQGRAGLRPGRDPRARQSLARREGPPGPHRRGAGAEFSGPETVYTRAGEQPRQIQRTGRGHDRRHPVRVRRLAHRPPAHEIMDAIRDKTADIPGILVEVTAPRAGPPTGKPVQIQLSALDPDLLPAAAKKAAAILRRARTCATSTTACRCPASTGASR